MKDKPRVDRTLEQEANLFAILLLMPSELFKRDMENGLDLSDDNSLKTIAKKYDVSITAVAARIAYYTKHYY